LIQDHIVYRLAESLNISTHLHDTWKSSTKDKHLILKSQMHFVTLQLKRILKQSQLLFAKNKTEDTGTKG